MTTPRTKRPTRPRRTHTCPGTCTHMHAHTRAPGPPSCARLLGPLLRLGYRARPGDTPARKQKGERECERRRARGSGYYRQTLIWPRSGLPSNFQALTRPLTRSSVNAPKRRDAYIRRPRFSPYQRRPVACLP